MSNFETPLGGANMVKPPILNWPISQGVKDMSDAELERYIQVMQDERKVRKEKKSEELVNKVCVMLNELALLGIHLVVEDSFGEECDATECAEFFDRQHFKVRR